MKLAELRPGWRSDFILHREGGAEIDELDDCIAVRTPANPGYYWGNFLLLPQAPGDDALAHWMVRFEQEIVRRLPGVEHVAIGINGPPAGTLPAWQAAGFELIETAVIELRPGHLRPAALAPRGAVQVRPLDLAHELDAAVELQCSDTHGFEPKAYAAYRRVQMQRYAALAERGLACWFGLWCDGVLAADCGLLRDAAAPGAGGRFQRVMTQPAWRRRGLCTALVGFVTAWGFENWRLDRILMCADPHDVAIGIYEALGYRRIEREACLQRKAPRDRAAAA